MDAPSQQLESLVCFVRRSPGLKGGEILLLKIGLRGTDCVMSKWSQMYQGARQWPCISFGNEPPFCERDHPRRTMTVQCR